MNQRETNTLCFGCGSRLRTCEESDWILGHRWVLRNLQTGDLHYYHTRCISSAYALLRPPITYYTSEDWLPRW